jgi:hypothetical protein
MFRSPSNLREPTAHTPPPLKKVDLLVCSIEHEKVVHTLFNYLTLLAHKNQEFYSSLCRDNLVLSQFLQISLSYKGALSRNQLCGVRGTHSGNIIDIEHMRRSSNPNISNVLLSLKHIIINRIHIVEETHSQLRFRGEKILGCVQLNEQL